MPSSSRQECLERAEACERQAERATVPTNRETLLYLANRWRTLAEATEAKNQPASQREPSALRE